MGLCVDYELAPDCGVGILYAFFAADDAAGREVRAFYELHQVFYLAVGIIYEMYDSVHSFI